MWHTGRKSMCVVQWEMVKVGVWRCEGFTGLCMLERCGLCSRAILGQFQPSSHLALIPQLNWMKDILLPLPTQQKGGVGNQGLGRRRH